ncbi:hypothetical protein VNO77_19879 [Canavalia gladiata]|uniref:Uncharacterized protein n=1 Tax=Canavalia gladiata TaxID=3824 RepID=A0AAN9LNI6_CANGL
MSSNPPQSHKLLHGLYLAALTQEKIVKAWIKGSSGSSSLCPGQIKVMKLAKRQAGRAHVSSARLGKCSAPMHQAILVHASPAISHLSLLPLKTTKLDQNRPDHSLARHGKFEKNNPVEVEAEKRRAGKD